MSITTSQQCLKAASAVVVAFGLIVALAAHPTTGGVASFFADMIFWPINGQPTLDTPAARLLAAICGGVLVGWGVLLWHVAAEVLPTNPALAARLVRSSLAAWFVVDGIGSAVAGAPLNGALNLLFLAAFLWPLSGAHADVSAR